VTLRIVGHKNAQFLYVIARKCGVRVVKKTVLITVALPSLLSNSTIITTDPLDSMVFYARIVQTASTRM